MRAGRWVACLVPRQFVCRRSGRACGDAQGQSSVRNRHRPTPRSRMTSCKGLMWSWKFGRLVSRLKSWPGRGLVGDPPESYRSVKLSDQGSSFWRLERMLYDQRLELKVARKRLDRSHAMLVSETCSSRAGIASTVQRTVCRGWVTTCPWRSIDGKHVVYWCQPGCQVLEGTESLRYAIE